MKKGFLLVLLISLLVLTACGQVQQGETPRDTAAIAQVVRTGTQGVDLQLLDNFPPATIYDQHELVSLIEVRNRGNHPLKAQSCFVQITGFDPNIIKGGFHIPRSCADTIGGDLEGKSLYNVEGGLNQLEFRSPDISLPPGVFEYNPTLNILACYNYHTSANPSVCVDPVFYQISQEQKSCIPRDVSAGGGQGGPVGVSYVNVDMVGGKAIFEINIRNFGTGRVLSPATDIRTCGQGSVSYQDFDRVQYNVQLLGGSINNCKPGDGFVRLNNNQGKIVCSFNIAGTTAYETPLLVDLDYSYVDSIKRPVRIIKTPQ